MGASPWQLLLMIEFEAFFVVLIAFIGASVIFTLALLFGQTFFLELFGVRVGVNWLSMQTLWLFLGVEALTLVLSFIPGWMAYRLQASF